MTARLALLGSKVKPAYDASPLANDPAVEPPQCLACGTCCFSLLESYVRVSGDDYERLGDRATELVWFDGIRAHMRMRQGHCTALLVDGKNRQYLCSVYETRPQVCRDLARGSSACLAERIAKSDRPLLTLRGTAR